MLARRILGSGRIRSVFFQPFLNSSGWWWLISSVFLIRISCHKTTHANGYYGAWPGWAVSVSVLPLTKAQSSNHLTTRESPGCFILTLSLPLHHHTQAIFLPFSSLSLEITGIRIRNKYHSYKMRCCH